MKPIDTLYFRSRSSMTAFTSRVKGAETDPSRIDKDPYYAGWLYTARGTPEANSLDVDGYIAVLDATIDKMLG